MKAESREVVAGGRRGRAEGEVEQCALPQVVVRPILGRRRRRRTVLAVALLCDAVALSRFERRRRIEVVYGSFFKSHILGCPTVVSMDPELNSPWLDPQFMRSHLSNWHDQVIDIQQKTKEMAFLSALKQIAGIESTKIAHEFMPEFFKFVQGTLSLPIDLPGTNYSNGIRARKNIVNILRNLIEERRASQDKQARHAFLSHED
ncbi:hypothetical protein Dimus_035833 [Dionaea muscipula]